MCPKLALCIVFSVNGVEMPFLLSLLFVIVNKIRRRYKKLMINEN